MAIVARVILKLLFAVLRVRSFRSSTAEPDLVVLWLHHDDFANHPGMAGAAVLGAKKVIASRRGWLDPEAGVAAGQNVRLYAKRRHEEVMDHVLGRHDQLHGSADGYV